jgi:hypothetical protein
MLHIAFAQGSYDAPLSTCGHAFLARERTRGGWGWDQHAHHLHHGHLGDGPHCAQQGRAYWDRPERVLEREETFWPGITRGAREKGKRG